MNKSIIGFAFHWFKQRKPKTVLYMLIYFIIRRKNMFIENIRFLFKKNIERYVKISDMLNFTIRINGSLMYIDFDDEGLSKQLYLHRIRERYSTAYLKKIIREDDVIIDIGANVGYYALLESRLAHKGHVFAIEPVQKNMQLLSLNRELNDYNNMSIIPIAIGDKNCYGEMNIYEKGNLCSFTENIQNKPIATIGVPMRTVDSFVEKYVSGHPTLIRMDVEGYEYQIIKGMTNILRANKPLILFIELHPFMMEEEDMDELIETLQQNNFKVGAIFCEPATSDYGSVNVLNKIFGILDMPKYGYAGYGYERLKEVLRKRDFTSTMAFFERI